MARRSEKPIHPESREQQNNAISRGHSDSNFSTTVELSAAPSPPPRTGTDAYNVSAAFTKHRLPGTPVNRPGNAQSLSGLFVARVLAQLDFTRRKLRKYSRATPATDWRRIEWKLARPAGNRGRRFPPFRATSAGCFSAGARLTTRLRLGIVHCRESMGQDENDQRDL